MRGAHRGVWCSKVHPLIEAELFAATGRTPCTGWPRTVMRGELRKVNSGHNSVPKANRRTEPSPRNPRFAAHLRCVSAKEGLGESRGGKGTIRCPCPLLPPPPGGGNPRPPKAAIVHAHLERKVASSGEPLYRRKVCRHPTVKQKGRLPSGGLIPSCSPHGAQRAPPGSLRAAPNAAATGSASHSPPQCSSLPPRPLPSRHPIQMVIPAYFFLRFSLFSALLSAPLPYYVPPRPLSSSVSADKIHLQNPEYFAQSTVYKNARIQYNDREHRGSVHGTIWKNPPLRSGP